MAELGINFIPGFKNPYQKGTESNLEEKVMWIEDNLFGLLQDQLTSSVPDAIDWVEKKLAERKFKKALKLEHAANVAKGPWIGGKIGPPTWTMSGIGPDGVARGPLAIKVLSKVLGPLQFMMPGTLHSGELTHAQRRDTHHPNTNIWSYTGD